jgi:hypothetical protein
VDNEHDLGRASCWDEQLISGHAQPRCQDIVLEKAEKRFLVGLRLLVGR